MALTRSVWVQSLVCALLLPLISAQSDPLATTVSASSPTPPTTTVTGSDMPSSSDDAPGSGSGSDSSDNNGTGTSTTSLVNYYFVFLALILCVAVLGIFLVWRKRKRAIAYARYHRQNPHQRDGSGWQGSVAGSRGHGRYWQGIWGQSRDDVAAREEGLNELGEAPPAYMPPKTREEEEREAQQRQEELAMPMQTLSRESAGLKPPDYSETSVQAVRNTDRHSAISEASGSRINHEERGTTSGGPSSS